jgi:hypothetical protein
MTQAWRRIGLRKGQRPQAKGMAKMSVGERRALVFWAAVLLALSYAKHAQAADITVLNMGNADLPAIVSVKGFLGTGDDQKFTTATIAGIRKAIVYLEGPGGEIGPSLNIGLVIKTRHFETAVAATKTCVSGCALAWLAGAPRHMGEEAHIGFHAAWIKETGSAAGTANAFIGYYVHELGLNFNTLRYIMAEPGSMSWLTRQDAADHGIGYDMLTKEQADRFAVVAAHPTPEVAQHVTVGPELCDAIRNSLEKLAREATAMPASEAQARSTMLLNAALSECLRKQK